MIRYKCERCRATLESPPSLAGQQDQCPICKHTCTVPQPKKGFTAVVGLCVGAVALLAVAIALLLVFRPPKPATLPESQPPVPTAAQGEHPPVAPKDVQPAVKQVSLPPATPPTGAPQPAARPASPAPATPPRIDSAPPPPLSPEQVFEKASPAVVYIVVRDKDFKAIGLGSGFFVDAGGLIVTNYHVIKGAAFATARLSTGATLFVDGVVATDPTNDLALLKTTGKGFAFLTLAQPDPGPLKEEYTHEELIRLSLPKVGSSVYAIGNPRGLENTFSAGIVSGHRGVNQGKPILQVTTPISPGSSGGPLLNASGQVVGVTTAYLTSGQNLNFAVPRGAVRSLMDNQGKLQTLASAGGGRLEKAETDELDKAWEAIRKEDWRGASEILTRLRKSQPDNPFVWFALGYLHRKLDNHEFAIQHYKQAIALKPDYAEAYFFMGVSYCGLDRYEDAIEAYTRCLVLNPQDAKVHCYIGNAYRSQAHSGNLDKPRKMKRSDIQDIFRKAVDAYSRALTIDSNYAEAWYGKGDAFDAIGKYLEAIEAFKKTIALKPDDAPAWFNLGSSYYKLGQWDEANAAFRESLRLEPNGLFADLGRKSITLIQSKEEADRRSAEIARVIEPLQRAVDANPRDAAAWYRLGAAYEKFGERTRAAGAYQRCVSLKATGELLNAAQRGISRVGGAIRD